LAAAKFLTLIDCLGSYRGIGTIGEGLIEMSKLIDETRRGVLGLGTATLLSSALSATAQAAGANGCAVSLIQSRRAFNAIRLFTGADGRANLEDIVVQSEEEQGLHIGGDPNLSKGFRLFLKKKAVELRVVNAPADFDFPAHKTAIGESEFFFMIQGSATLITPNGSRSLSAGSIVLTNDGNTGGHTGKVGPEGFTAISVRYVD
jgi:hypothetical protein